MRYVGRGVLSGPGVGRLRGDAEFRQEESGKMTVELLLDDEEQGRGRDAQRWGAIWAAYPRELRFRMQTSDGTEIASDSWHTIGSREVHGIGRSLRIIGMLSNAVATHHKEREPGPIRWFQYFLTNLDFLGTEVTRRSLRGGRVEIRRDRISLSVGDRRAVLRLRPDHSSIMTELTATRSVRVTAELWVAGQGDDDATAVDDLVSDVVTLLGLGAGNHVAWVLARVFDASGRKVVTRHRFGITRPYVPHPVIPPNHGHALRRLVECLPGLGDRNQAWATAETQRPFSEAIKSFLDACQENRYLELRSLNASVVGEILAGSLAMAEGKDLLMPTALFDLVSPEIKQAVQHVGEQFNLSREQITGLGRIPNRPTLRSNLTALMKEAGSPSSNDAISRFIRIRDSLAHTGRHPRPSRMSSVEQHWFVMDFIARLILGLLGYRGSYVEAGSRQQVEFP